VNEPTTKKRGFLCRWTGRLLKTAFVLIIVAIPAVYFGAPCLAKTNWAKGKAEAALTRLTGSPAHIDSMTMSWKTGFTVSNVRMDAINRGRLEITPTIKTLRFAPQAKTMCSSHKVGLTLVEPTIAIRERSEEVATPAPACAGKNDCCASKGVHIENLVIENGTVTYDCDAFNQPVTLKNLALRAEVQVRNGRVNIELKQMTGRLNDGLVTASGLFSIEPGTAKGSVNLEATDVTANDVLARVMKYLAPIFETAAQGEVKGKVNLKLTAEGKGENAGAMIRAAKGQALLVFNGLVTDTRLMGAISARFQNPSLAGAPFDAVRANVVIADGAFLHQNTVASTPAGSISINGTVDRNDLNLLVRMDPNIFGGRDSEALRMLAEQGGLRVRGTMSQPIVE